MNFAWAHMWIKTFAESADKVVELYADPFLFEDLLLGQQITDKEELRRAFKVLRILIPLAQQGRTSLTYYAILATRSTG
jgi:hypothetical protein